MPHNLMDEQFNSVGEDAPLLDFQAPALSAHTKRRDYAFARYTILPDSPQLTWSDKDRTASETYLMHSWSVPGFVQRAIGLRIAYHEAPFFMREKRRMPGSPELCATRISARPFEPRPADPFITDPLIAAKSAGGALDGVPMWLQTYSRYMAVTIEYSSDVTEPGHGDKPGGPVGPNDIEWFTETKLTAGGEFMSLGQQNTYFVPIVGKDYGGVTDVLHQPAGDIIRWHLNRANQIYVGVSANAIAEAERNGSYEVSHAKVIPTRERTIIWRHVWNVPHQTIMDTLGKVNSDLGLPAHTWSLAFLDFAPPETVLFAGASITREALTAPDGRPLYTIEYKFIEKQIRVFVSGDAVIYDGDGLTTPVHPASMKILGWNHYWRTAAGVVGGGWFRLIVNKTTGESPYKKADFRTLFEGEQMVLPVHYSPIGDDFDRRAARIIQHNPEWNERLSDVHYLSPSP